MRTRAIVSPFAHATAIPILVLLLTIISISFTGLAENAYADLYKCNGQWTNKPCSSGKEAVLDTNKRGTSKTSNAKTTTKIKTEVSKDKESSEDSSNKKDKAVKSAILSGLKSANRACDNYFNYSQIRNVERLCNKSSATGEDCYGEWEARFSEILSNVQDEKCRKAVFSAVNRVDSKRN